MRGKKRSKMLREDDGVYNIDGWSHRYISFRGERIYENPFPGARINDDEIAGKCERHGTCNR